MNEDRRQFLKILLIGGASFIAGKILGPVFSKFLDSPLAKKELPKETDSSISFRVFEDKKTFSVYDESGEEIFQIDKGA